jgi:hypothetical protein
VSLLHPLLLSLTILILEGDQKSSKYIKSNANIVGFFHKAHSIMADIM